MPKQASNFSQNSLHISEEPTKIIPLNSDVEKDIPFTYNDYQPADENTSAFAALKLHEKRAVLTEANIQLHGFRKSANYAERAKDPQTAHQILGYYCEKYASDPRRVEELFQEENDVERRFSEQRRPQNSLKAYYQKCSHGVAKRLDNFYSAEYDKINKIKNIMPEGRLSQSFRPVAINHSLTPLVQKKFAAEKGNGKK